MWPRLFSRGRQPFVAVARPAFSASMWPRLFSRGRTPYFWGKNKAEGLLQCGRGCLAAEGLRLASSYSISGYKADFEGSAFAGPKFAHGKRSSS